MIRWLESALFARRSHDICTHWAMYLSNLGWVQFGMFLSYLTFSSMQGKTLSFNHLSKKPWGKSGNFYINHRDSRVKPDFEYFLISMLISVQLAKLMSLLLQISWFKKQKKFSSNNFNFISYFTKTVNIQSQSLISFQPYRLEMI